MKKIETLKKNYEFKNVLNRGKYFIKEQIIVYIKQNNKNKNIIGIAINTKICNAVQRNKIKRLIRENYRQYKNIKKGYDIVFLWNKKANPEKVSFYKIKSNMYEIFKDSGILNDNKEEKN